MKTSRKPSSPDDVLARSSARRRALDPATWGVAAGLQALPTSKKVVVDHDAGGRIAQARRLDAFDNLHRAGGLTDFQHQAAQRLIKDWATMLGVAGAPEVVKLGVDADFDWVKADRINVRMMLARDAVAAALGAVGPENAALLKALVEPIVLTGMLTWWRGEVQRVTGETDKNCQGCVVRRACENLRLHYGLGAPSPRAHPFNPGVEIRAEESDQAAPAVSERSGRVLEELLVYVDEHGHPDPVRARSGSEVEVLRRRRL